MIGQTSIIPNIRIVSNHSIILDKAEISELELETAKTLHNPKLNYSLGIDFTHQLNDKLSIRAGLAFQDIVDIGSKTKVEPSGIYEFDQFRSVTHYQYLQLPIGVQYSLSQKQKWSFFVDFGWNINYFVKNYQDITTFSNDKKIERNRTKFENTSYREINFGLQTGLEINYNISDKLFCRFVTSGDIFRLSFNKESNLLARHYNYGISVGLGYNL